jgi:peroxiredoxin
MKRITYLFIASVLFVACSSEPHFVIKGKIEGSDGITFYLQKRDSGKTVTLDSAVSKRGSFILKGVLAGYPRLIQLVAGNTMKRTSFYLENSDISVKGSLDSLYKAIITGSKTQDEYNSFVDSNKPLSARYSKISIKYQAAARAGDAENVALLQKEADSVQTAMIDLQKSFVKNNPASYVTPSLLVNLSVRMDAIELESIINELDTAIAALPQIKTLKDRVAVMKSVAVGQKAPDFTMNDVNGKPFALSSKIGSRLLLIDFWAAWCGPCRQENPNLVKIYNEFKKKGFDVLGVSLDQEKEDWVKAIAEDKLMWTNVSDLQEWGNSAARLFAVNAIPANFLLDEAGIIIAKNLRGDALYNKVSEVLEVKK